MAFVIVAACLIAVGLAGQSATAEANQKKAVAAKSWTSPLTPDGQPDLQGIWINDSATPLERPKALEGRASLTDDEVTELTARAARFAQNDSDYAPGDDLFLAVLADVDHYKRPSATEGQDLAEEREFDKRTSLIIDPPDGKLPPLTPEGRQRERARVASLTGTAPTGPEEVAISNRCITFGVPRLGASFNSYYQIVQTKKYFVFHGEVIHDARVIPLDGRPHLPDNIRLWNGDSRGRWEGSTLIIDTTNFSEKSIFMGSAEHLHLIERFTRVADDMIHYSVTVDDLTTWTKPWTAVIHLKKRQENIFEFACHEGNEYVMQGILAGARAEDKKTEEAAASPK